MDVAHAFCPSGYKTGWRTVMSRCRSATASCSSRDASRSNACPSPHALPAATCLPRDDHRTKDTAPPCGDPCHRASPCPRAPRGHCGQLFSSMKLQPRHIILLSAELRSCAFVTCPRRARHVGN